MGRNYLGMRLIRSMMVVWRFTTMLWSYIALMMMGWLALRRVKRSFAKAGSFAVWAGSQVKSYHKQTADALLSVMAT